MRTRIIGLPADRSTAPVDQECAPRTFDIGRSLALRLARPEEREAPCPYKQPSLLTGTCPLIVIEGNGFTPWGRRLVPGYLCAACTISACRRGASVTTELFRVGADDLQPETVCDYFASRAEPPWPQRPAPDADPVARRFVAEGMHALWTHLALRRRRAR